MDLGIDQDQGFVYEGRGHYGRAVLPAPLITPARIVFESEGPLRAEKSSDPITTACRFREDYYDPTARIRRGRFYFAVGVQPVQWFVQPHPALPFETAAAAGEPLRKELFNFQGNSIWHRVIQGRREQPLVLLGLDDRFTIWTIIDVEGISWGEDLVTLKARGSFGILPTIDDGMIPEPFRARIHESLNAFADEVHRSAPISVIDRARDAASQCLLAHFNLTGSEARDLGDLAKKLEADGRVIAANSAQTIARFHARAKPVERAKRAMRPIREQDAELSIHCVGAILCELGWADWA